MKIAVTCEEDGAIAKELVNAELYRIYEIECGTVKDSELVRTISAGHKIIAPFLADKDVEALICGEVDKNAKRVYSRYGVILYSGNLGDANSILEKFLIGDFEY